MCSIFPPNLAYVVEQDLKRESKKIFDFISNKIVIY